MPIAALVLARQKEALTLAEILEKAGCSTRAAASLEEAKAALGSFQPRLVVADWAVVLKEPLVFESLRKLCQGLKVILIAPHNVIVDARDLLKDHDTLLPQPLDADGLLEAVARVQGGKGASFVAALLAMPGKFLARNQAARRGQAVGVVERERSRVFQVLYKAIAAQQMVPTAGLEVWDRLAALEPLWARLKNDDGAAQSDLLGLAERYQQLCEWMTAMAQSGSVGSMRKREPGEVDLACLQGLFARVREGGVSQEQFHEAWTVWSLPTEQREKNELFQLMWAAKRRKSGSSQRIRSVQPGSDKVADLIDIPTESKKIKRVKAPGESQRMRAVKAPAPPEVSPGEKPAADESAGGGSRRVRKVKPPSQPPPAPTPPALAGDAPPPTPPPSPGIALGAPIARPSLGKDPPVS